MINCSHFSFSPTPCITYKKLSENLNVNLVVKHDDLFNLSGGGNKARKLQYIIANAQKNKINAIVTAGGLQSNHVRATSIMCTLLGWKAIMIVHAEKPQQDIYDGNLKLTKLSGSEIRFVDMCNVSHAMDSAMNDLKEEGYNPLYIWGGGHCLEGTFSYYKAVEELKDQLCNLNPDYIVVASGTGTTQAGLEIGARHFFPDCKILGVSVARKTEKGKEIILNSFKELNALLQKPVRLPNDVFFDDRWIGGGYEETYPELIETILWAAKTEGLILDPTYTGKAFHAFRKYVETELIPKNSNVVFWHTGGLLNLMASNKI